MILIALRRPKTKLLNSCLTFLVALGITVSAQAAPHLCKLALDPGADFESIGVKYPEEFLSPLLPRHPEFVSEDEQKEILTILDGIFAPILAKPDRNGPALSSATLDFLALAELPPWKAVALWLLTGPKLRAAFERSSWSSSHGYHRGERGEVYFMGTLNHSLVIPIVGFHVGHIFTGQPSVSEAQELWSRGIVPYGSLTCRTCKLREMRARANQ